jgi:hypothetical protein
MSKQNPNANHFKTSIGLTMQDQVMLDYLCKIHNYDRTNMVRRLVIEAYSVIKYVEQK